MNTNIKPQLETATKQKKKTSIKDEEYDFKIEHLFGSKTRVRLLNLFLEHPDRPFYVREITRKIDAQLNSVRRELQNLINLGIFSEIEGKIIAIERTDVKNKSGKSDKKKYYIANKNFAFFDELRSMMKKSAVLMNKTLVQQLTSDGEIDLLILTGHFIDNEDVASDILIVGDIDTEKLQNAINSFEKELVREINYTYMPRDEFTYRSDVKDRFLMSLLETDKVVLVNNISANV